MPKTRSYTDVIKSMSALTGMSPSRITVGGDIEALWRVLFANAMRDIWERGPWPEVCPYGEARFAGNHLTYCNDFTQSVWTATALTITNKAVVNPLDQRRNASQLLETSAESEHSVQQAAAFIPDTNYEASVFVRARGRTVIELEVNDGDSTFTSRFNLTDNETSETTSGATASIVRQANGFYRCMLGFTSSANATGSGTFTIKLLSSMDEDVLVTDGGEAIITSEDELLISSEGDETETDYYYGDTAKGVYLWGALLQQATYTGREDNTIEFEQDGEDKIESIFDVYYTSPVGARYPSRLRYELTAEGVQLLGTAQSTTYLQGTAQYPSQGPSPNPVFLYYRKRCPSLEGETLDASVAYAVDDQVYFVDSDSIGNFYRCITATSAGETPTTHASKWELIPIHDTFFQSCIYRTFADYLISDGQMDKAVGALQLAERQADEQFDRLMRQQDHQFPFKISTHVSARP